MFSCNTPVGRDWGGDETGRQPQVHVPAEPRVNRPSVSRGAPKHPLGCLGFEATSCPTQKHCEWPTEPEKTNCLRCLGHRCARSEAGGPADFPRGLWRPRRTDFGKDSCVLLRAWPGPRHAAIGVRHPAPPRSEGRRQTPRRTFFAGARTDDFGSWLWRSSRALTFLSSRVIATARLEGCGCQAAGGGGGRYNWAPTKGLLEPRAAVGAWPSTAQMPVVVVFCSVRFDATRSGELLSMASKRRRLSSDRCDRILDDFGRLWRLDLRIKLL